MKKRKYIGAKYIGHKNRILGSLSLLLEPGKVYKQISLEEAEKNRFLKPIFESKEKKKKGGGK